MEIPQTTLTPEQAKSLELLVARTVQMLAHSQGWGRGCLACIHFDEARELCGKWGERPPARVIVSGCPAFAEHPF